MITALLILALACIHFFVANIRHLSGSPRSKWLSFAGGVSVTYVLLHLLPELHKEKASVHLKEFIYIALPTDSIYLFMLLGFTAFYGLEHLAESSKASAAGDRVENKNVFYVHVGSFAAYNFILGCMMAEQRQDEPLLNEIVLTAALALHFTGNDLSLYNHHKERYLKIGRWLLGAAVIAGYAVNCFFFIQYAWITMALSVVTGAIILNAIKEELPKANKTRFLSFFAGVIIYAVLLYTLKVK